VSGDPADGLVIRPDGFQFVMTEELSADGVERRVLMTPLAKHPDSQSALTPPISFSDEHVAFMLAALPLLAVGELGDGTWFAADALMHSGRTRLRCRR